MRKGVGIILMFVALILILLNINKIQVTKEVAEEITEEILESKYEYGILVDSFNVVKGKLKKTKLLGENFYMQIILATRR